jgi:hypothetical protein
VSSSRPFRTVEYCCSGCSRNWYSQIVVVVVITVVVMDLGNRNLTIRMIIMYRLF